MSSRDKIIFQKNKNSQHTMERIYCLLIHSLLETAGLALYIFSSICNIPHTFVRDALLFRLSSSSYVVARKDTLITL